MRQQERAPATQPVGEAPGSDSRTALLEAALHCFAHRGFDGASIRDIAAKAERNSSLISHHFGSKEELYEEVFRYVLRSRKSAFGPDIQGSAPKGREEAIRVVTLLREQVAPWLRSFGDCLGILRPELTEVQRKFLGISVMAG